MASADWNQWAVGPPNSLSVATTAVAPTGGGTLSLRMEDTAVDSNDAYGYIYDGPDVGGFKSTGVLITVVMKSTGPLAERGAHGAMFWGSNLSGNISDAAVDCINIGPRAEGTSGGCLIRATRHNNGGFSTYNNGTELSCSNFEGDWIQYQAAVMVDTNQPTAEARRIGMWARCNNGAALSAPGSAGWTDWTLLKRVDNTSDAAMHAALNLGCFGGFGYVISSGSSGTPSRIDWNNIIVEYGTII